MLRKKKIYIQGKRREKGGKLQNKRSGNGNGKRKSRGLQKFKQKLREQK